MLIKCKQNKLQTPRDWVSFTYSFDVCALEVVWTWLIKNWMHLSSMHLFLFLVFSNIQMGMWNWKWLVSTLFSFMWNLWIAKRCVWGFFSLLFALSVVFFLCLHLLWFLSRFDAWQNVTRDINCGWWWMFLWIGILFIFFHGPSPVIDVFARSIVCQANDSF